MNEIKNFFFNFQVFRKKERWRWEHSFRSIPRLIAQLIWFGIFISLVHLKQWYHCKRGRYMKNRDKDLGNVSKRQRVKEIDL